MPPGERPPQSSSSPRRAAHRQPAAVRRLARGRRVDELRAEAMSHPDLGTATADGLRPATGPRDALDRAGCRVLRTFVGLEPTPAILAAIGGGEASGVTL